jgi:transposase
VSCFAALDVGLNRTSICVLDRRGRPVAERDVATTVEAVAGFLRDLGRPYACVGLEAATAPHWLRAGLARRRFRVVPMDAFHAHGYLKARRNKTDRNDARGLAEMLVSGIHREVHSKSLAAVQVKALLGSRAILVRKRCDFERSLLSLVREFGLPLRPGGRLSFIERVREAVAADPFVESVALPLLGVCAALRDEQVLMERRMKDAAKADPVCRRLMTAPGVGAFVALTFRAAVDDPARFTRSRDVAAHFGLTPRAEISGKMRRQGGISRRGDPEVRRALFLAAISALRPTCRKNSDLQAWARQVAARRGAGKGTVALARRLATVLHMMWTREEDFRWAGASPPV